MNLPSDLAVLIVIGSGNQVQPRSAFADEAAVQWAGRAGHVRRLFLQEPGLAVASLFSRNTFLFASIACLSNVNASCFTSSSCLVLTSWISTLTSYILCAIRLDFERATTYSAAELQGCSSRLVRGYRSPKIALNRQLAPPWKTHQLYCCEDFTAPKCLPYHSHPSSSSAVSSSMIWPRKNNQADLTCSHLLFPGDPILSLPLRLSTPVVLAPDASGAL
jgi:hypothetical protein